MTERDRVLDAFRNCITEPKCKGCPWTECKTLGNATIEIPRDLALAVMRELVAQEPVEPFLDYDGNDVWRCGNCHCKIFHPSRTDADENEKNYRRFCFHCGMEVKWK